MGRKKDDICYSESHELNFFGFCEYTFLEPWDYKSVHPKQGFWYAHAENNSYNPFEEDLDELERLQKIKENRLDRIEQAINLLTPKQQAIIKLLLKGLNQQEVADTLGITQSCVNLTLYGSMNKGHGNKRFGGIYKKIRKILEKNNENNSNNNYR